MSKELKTLIVKNLLIPVDVSKKEYPLLRKIEKSSNSQLKGLQLGLFNVYGWVGANPNSKSKTEITKLLYIQDSKKKNSEFLLPTKDAFDNLISVFAKSETRNVFIQGKRGCGKSASINYVFNCRYEEVKEQRVTIYRADIAKLHDKINFVRANFSRPLISLTRYTILHAFMVTMAHSDGKEECFKLFWADAYGSGSVRNTNFFSYINAKDGSELAGIWAEIANAFRRKNKSKIEDADLIDFIDKCDAFSEDEIVDVWDIFCKFLKSSQHGKLKRIILIFDGVDNLHADEFILPGAAIKTNGQWYIDYLQQIRAYYLNQPNIATADQFVYCFRTSTYIDFFRLGSALSHGSKSEIIFTCEAMRPNKMVISRLLRLDHKALRGILMADVSESDKQVVDKVNRDIDALKNDLTSYSRHLLYAQRTVLQAYIKFRNTSQQNANFAYLSVSLSDIVNYVFNGNIRSFFRNQILGFCAISNYTKLNLGAPISMEHIFESSLLSGYTYPPQNFDPNAKGRWCPNLFECNYRNETGKWQALCGLRILQLLPEISTIGDGWDSMSSSDLYRFLGKLQYQEAHCIRTLNMLLEFGLIEITDQTSEATPRYAKTFKGSFIEWLLFNNAAVLYLMASSSSFPRPRNLDQFGEEALVGRWLHKASRPRLFWTCAARTSVQFLRAIYATHRQEKRIAVTLLDEQERSLFKRLVRPSFKPIVSQIVERIGSVSADSSQYENEVNLLVREWRDTLRNNKKR